MKWTQSADEIKRKSLAVIFCAAVLALMCSVYEGAEEKQKQAITKDAGGGACSLASMSGMGLNTPITRS